MNRKSDVPLILVRLLIPVTAIPLGYLVLGEGISPRSIWARW